jgi:hypothetical protein
MKYLFIRRMDYGVAILEKDYHNPFHFLTIAEVKGNRAKERAADYIEYVGLQGMVEEPPLPFAEWDKINNSL